MELREDSHSLCLERRKQPGEAREAFREHAGLTRRKPHQEAECLGLRVIHTVSYLTERSYSGGHMQPGLFSKILCNLERWKKIPALPLSGTVTWKDSHTSVSWSAKWGQYLTSHPTATRLQDFTISVAF